MKTKNSNQSHLIRLTANSPKVQQAMNLDELVAHIGIIADDYTSRLAASYDDLTAQSLYRQKFFIEEAIIAMAARRFNALKNPPPRFRPLDI